MQHKIMLCSIGDLAIAFFGDHVEQVFYYDRCYRLPGVQEEMAWVHGLRGRVATSVPYWSMLENLGIRAFERCRDLKIEEMKQGILAVVDDHSLSFPVTTLGPLIYVADQSIGRVEECPLGPEKIGSWDGKLVINPRFMLSLLLELRTAA